MQRLHEEYFNDGKKYFDEMDNEKAKKYFDIILNSPQHYLPKETLILAYIYRGIIYRDQGENEEAVDNFTQALEIDPNSVTAHTHRAIAYVRLEQNNRAAENFEMALKLDPEDVEANYFYGYNMNTVAGKTLDENNINNIYYEKVLQLPSQSIRIFDGMYNSHGLVYKDKGDRCFDLSMLDKAARHFDEALPFIHISAIYNIQGAAYYQIKNYGEAFYCLSQVFELVKKENHNATDSMCRNWIIVFNTMLGVSFLDEIKKLSKEKQIKLLLQCLDPTTHAGESLKEKTELLPKIHAHLQSLIANDLNKVQLVLSAASYDESSAFSNYASMQDINNLIVGNFVQITGIYEAACTLFSRKKNTAPSVLPSQAVNNTPNF